MKVENIQISRRMVVLRGASELCLHREKRDNYPHHQWLLYPSSRPGCGWRAIVMKVPGNE